MSTLKEREMAYVTWCRACSRTTGLFADNGSHQQALADGIRDALAAGNVVERVTVEAARGVYAPQFGCKCEAATTAPPLPAATPEKVLLAGES